MAGDAGGELAEGVHCGRYFEWKQTKADYALSRGVFANMRELSAFAPSFFRGDWRDDESPPCRMPDLILPQPCGKVPGGAINAFFVVAGKDDIAIHAVVVAGTTADFHLRAPRPGARSAFPPTPPNFPRGRGQRAAFARTRRMRTNGRKNAFPVALGGAQRAAPCPVPLGNSPPRRRRTPRRGPGENRPLDAPRMSERIIP